MPARCRGVVEPGRSKATRCGGDSLAETVKSDHSKRLAGIGGVAMALLGLFGGGACLAVVWVAGPVDGVQRSEGILARVVGLPAVVTVMGSLLAVGLAACGLVLSRRELQARRRAEAALRSTLEELEERVARRTSELAESEARKVAEKQLRVTLESIGDGFIACDREWRFVYVNTPALELLGFTREELMGRVFWEVFPGAVGTRLEAAYWEGAAGRIQDFENLYEPWGRWFRNRVFPREGGGATVWFQEITEHKRAALALAVSEQRAHLAMELARAGTWEWDLTSGRNHWSEELWTLYGLEPGVREPSFELWRESVHPEDVGEVMASLEASVKRGEELNLEWRVGAGGVERWLMSRGRPLRDGSGRVVRYLGIVIDISERRRLEEEARRWLTVFHSAQFGLAYASVTDNSFLGMNDAFARERGYTPGELVGRSFMEIYPPEERLAQKERVRLIDAQGHLVFDSVHQRKDGTRFPVLMEVTVIKDASGRPQSRVAYALDITERKRAEAALQERNEELVRFIYTVSHDLKSPLVTIRTFLGYLEQDLRTGDAERVEKDMGYMRRAAEKMVNLLEDLLDLSRVGRKTNPMEDVTLQALVRDALDLVAGAIAERGVRVEVTEAPVLLTGDRGRLLEVFQNLIDNAVKFMGEQASPRVDIGVEDGADGLVLFVRDNGIGIDPRHHGKLFGLFEKLHPGTPGTGIGLALVKRIVEVHGGRIWAESGGAGQGTVFRFTLARLRRATPTPPTQG